MNFWAGVRQLSKYLATPNNAVQSDSLALWERVRVTMLVSATRPASPVLRDADEGTVRLALRN
jgi:hypothetical protein